MNLFGLKSMFTSLKCHFLTIILILILISSCDDQLIENVVLSNKTIALTFDDGPDPVYTDLILDILKEKDVKATFFLIGKKMQQYPEITERIFDEGHCLGNHTFEHFNLEKQQFHSIFISIFKTEQILENVCGKSLRIMRPPWGKVTPEEKDKLKKGGFKVVLWDVNSKDFMPNITVNEIINNVMTGAGDKKIVLFHDSDYLCKASRANTIAALPQIIDLLKQLGYRFVTINEMENIGN